MAASAFLVTELSEMLDTETGVHIITQRGSAGGGGDGGIQITVGYPMELTPDSIDLGA